MNPVSAELEYRFGRHCLRPRARQLLLDATPLKIGARDFDLLLALVERNDRVVTKDELLELVWPGLVVEENTLHVHISALRRLLGAQALATIPGRGYRFTLELQAPGPPLPLSSAPTAQGSAVALQQGAPAVERRVAAGPPARVPWLVPIVAAGVLALGALGTLAYVGLKQQDAGKVAAATSAAPLAVPEQSIAVLPFADLSEKKDQEYFADGLSEQLLDGLSRVPGLRVVARTSAFSFKGRTDDIPTIARKLSVANVLEGSVRTSGKNVRITVQLVRADTGYHLWSQSYDRKLDDILKVQDEISRSVVDTLQASLLQEPLPPAAGSHNADAYLYYLRARSVAQRAGPPADYAQIVDYLQRALKLDPGFAGAWAALASAQASQASYGYVDSTRGWNDARRSALRAVELGPQLPDAHAALAKILYLHDWNWRAAQAQISEALRLDPNSPSLAWAGYLAVAQGQLDRAQELLERAVARNPLDSHIHAYFGVIRYRAGRIAEARNALQMALDLNPSEAGAHMAIATALLAAGDAPAALAEVDQEKDPERNAFGHALVLQALGRKAEADAALARLEKDFAQFDPYDIAAVHAYRGEIDQAFAWLDRAYSQRDYAVTWVATDSLLIKLHGDARYGAFLRRMNLAA